MRSRPRPPAWPRRSTPACRSPARRSATGPCGSSSGCGPSAIRRCARSPPTCTRRYREWIESLIAAGVESGEWAAEREPEEIAELAIAVIDGAGVRALIRDPAAGVDHARSLVAELLADELGIEAGALATTERER